jgi:hypothetical protein
MRLSDPKSAKAAGRKRWFGGSALAAVLWAGTAAAAFAGPLPPASTRTGERVEALALQWFAQMKEGRIDRGQLTPEYSAQLTDDVVDAMSRYLKKYDYGAPPSDARVLRTRAVGDQTFYLVKLVFPRGDAASLLFGFDPEGKITGLSIISMAGD